MTLIGSGEKMSGPSDFQPSVDLVREARIHWSFLHRIYRAADLRKENFLRHALWRYETKWLPLLATNQSADVEPPLDVHWIWIVHMLCPRKYIEDCKSLLNFVPDHKFFHGKGRHLAEATAMGVWQNMYPDQPFLPSFKNVADIPVDQGSNFNSALSYDVLGAALRQHSFFYNVSLSHYKDKRFLHSALDRYRKFVCLKKMYPDTFLVPMYDVDFLWHTHQLCPRAYQMDTTNYLGFVLNHDDSNTDRSVGSKLNTSGVDTGHLWRKEYGEHLAKPGTLHRGTDAWGTLERLDAAEMQAISVKKCTYILDRIRIDIPQQTGEIYLRLQVYPLSGERKTINFPPRSSSSSVWTSNHKNGLYSVQTTASNDVIMDFNVFYKKSGLMGIINKWAIVGTTKVCLSNELSYHTNSETGEFRVSQALGHGATIYVEFINSECFLNNMTLLLETLPFEKMDSKEAADLWGPVSLPHPIPGVTSECCVAMHKLIHSKQQTEAFACRVLHSQSLRMSAAQVFHQNKMVAMAHTIGSDQLPTPRQVSSSGHHVTLEPGRGMRAMLIRNWQGDWGVVTGVWAGFQRGVPPAGRQQEGIPGDQGHLKVVFTRLNPRGNQTTGCNVLGKIYPSPNSPRSLHFTLNGTQVTLNKSAISLRPLWGEDLCYPEKVALVFSALTLYVLCQPRPDVGATGHVPTPLSRLKREIEPIHRGGREIEELSPYQYPLVQAAGHLEDTPSNSWYYWLARKTRREQAIRHRKSAHLQPHTDNNRTMASSSKSAMRNHTSLREQDEEADTDEDGVGLDLAVDDAGSLFCPWDPDDELLGSRYGAVCGGCGGCGSSCLAGYSSSGLSWASSSTAELQQDDHGFTVGQRRPSACPSLCRMFSATDSECSQSHCGGWDGLSTRLNSVSSYATSVGGRSSFSIK